MFIYKTNSTLVIINKNKLSGEMTKYYSSKKSQI